MRRVTRYLKAAIEARLNVSYTPTGEDIILRYLFNSVGISRPDYIDVGANDPVSGNNTYVFYRDGSSGVCVEAHPALAREIASVRRRDKCLNVAVGVGDQKHADFYVFDPSGLSTLDPDEAKRRQAMGTYKVVDIVKIPVCNLDDLIATHFATYPALLSLDIEGMDLAVLRSLDYERFPIPVICVETVAYSENHIRDKERSIIDLLESQGYFLYADTYINSILVCKSWYRKQVAARHF